MESARDYYRSHGSITSPGTHAATLGALPRDIASLCNVIQGVLIHRDIAPFLYDLRLSEGQRDAANLRSVTAMMSAIVAADARPMMDAREPASRLPCVCRHFATMLAAILREQGVPARARCGFGAYFMPGRFEDHWVAEYWNESQQRWILVDAQLDAVQRKAFRIKIDPLDIPGDKFVVAADAWQMCREGRADPKLFGLSIINEAGLWWIAQNLIRDLANLNRVEMLPWDVWGIMPEPTDELGADEIALLDRVAELIRAGDSTLPELREIYNDRRLHLPTVIFNASRQARETISIQGDAVMLSWGQFERLSASIAEAGRKLIHQHGIGLAYLATVRKDGAPRLHPICPTVFEGGLYALIGPTHKQRDLLRDGRFALHSFPRPDVDDEFLVMGRARMIDDNDLRARVLADLKSKGMTSTEDELLFEFQIDRAMHAGYPGGHGTWPPKYSVWTER